MNNSIFEIIIVVIAYFALNTWITFKYVVPYLKNRRDVDE